MKDKINKFKTIIKYITSQINNNLMHDDIYIVEFPKSGITWLSFIISNIEIQRKNIDEYVTFYNIQKYIPDLHMLNGAQINRRFLQTFLKSHSTNTKIFSHVIYLIRNPEDVMVSYYNYMCDRGYKGNFNDFIRSNQYGIDSWVTHVESWYYKKNISQRIHFIKYEELKHNTVQTIKDLYTNLGLPLDDKVIELAIENSDLEKMKNSEIMYSKHNPNYSTLSIGKGKKLDKNLLLNNDAIELIKEKTQHLTKELY